MTSAPRILLILFEGLPGTVIESQVLVHAREMARIGIASFEIWAVAWSGTLYGRSLAAQPRAQEVAGCTVRVIRGIRPAMPFSVMLNALILWMSLLRYRPQFDVLHARTDYAAVVAGLLKRCRQFVLIWDCRGDAVAEFGDRYEPHGLLERAVRAIRLRSHGQNRRRAGRACDRAIFVSSTLEALVAPEIDGKPRRVIPCTASGNLFYLDAALRDQTRRQLGFGEDNQVFAFSGSLAAYQCFDATLALFAKIQAHTPQARLLVLTPEIDAAERLLCNYPGLKNAVLRSATISEMNAYLNAADAAFMLREPTATNRAAFPTKFAEYCLTGLAVIMTSAIPDAYAVAQCLGNLITPPTAGTVVWPERYDRIRVAEDARSRLARTSVVSLYAEIYQAGSYYNEQCNSTAQR